MNDKTAEELVTEEMEAMPAPPSDDVEEPQDNGWGEDLTEELSSMDDEFGGPREESEDEEAKMPAEEVVEPEARSTEATTTESESEVEEPTDDSDDAVLRLSHAEVVDLLAGRGRFPEEEETPEPSESEAERQDSETQAAWQSAYDHYVNAYALDEDAASEVMVNPEVVLPKMGASITMQTIQAVVGLLPSILPQILEAHQSQIAVRSAKEEALKAALGEHEVEAKYVEAAEDMVRRLQPELEGENPADFGKATAQLLRNVLGLKEEKPRAQIRPRTPAAARSARVTPLREEPDNIFASMAEEDISDM